MKTYVSSSQFSSKTCKKISIIGFEIRVIFKTGSGKIEEKKYAVVLYLTQTYASLVKLVHVCSCCKLVQHATATFGSKKMADDNHELL